MTTSPTPSASEGHWLVALLIGLLAVPTGFAGTVALVAALQRLGGPAAHGEQVMGEAYAAVFVFGPIGALVAFGLATWLTLRFARSLPVRLAVLAVAAALAVWSVHLLRAA